MLDIGWSELLVIGVVALIVVGPKDLPKLFRSLGQWVGRARGLARDFQRAMNDAADESGISDIKKSFDEAASTKNMGLDNWDKAMPGKAAASAPVKDTGNAAGSKPVKASDAPAPTKDPGAPDTASKPAAKAPAKKPAAKKPAAKPAAKKPAAKAAGKPASGKSATGKTAAKKAVT